MWQLILINFPQAWPGMLSKELVGFVIDTSEYIAHDWTHSAEPTLGWFSGKHAYMSCD